ncbi:MAG: hypothetical protein ACXVDB_05305 [Tumebacillaceae bacterium]
MYGILLLLCVAMILYGVVRFGIAKWRREEEANMHVLWIPGAAFVFACGVCVCTWVF